MGGYTQSANTLLSHSKLFGPACPYLSDAGAVRQFAEGAALQCMPVVDCGCCEILDKVLGRFLQNLAVFMKWCDASSVDSLWQPLTTQWWGVGTSQGRWEALSVNTWFAVVYMRP
jgi:hypothetical protein